jgi:hypothetical protein
MHQAVAYITDTLIAAWCVDTSLLTASIVHATLIHVFTGFEVHGWPEARVAHATETTNHVHTVAIGANIIASRALINIFAYASIVRQLLAWGTEALEGTHGVDALTPTTDASYHCTLINICAHLHHHGGLKAAVAIANKSTRAILTGAVAASTKGNPAFVNVHTMVAVLIQCITHVTLTDKRTNHVTANTVRTDIREDVTLVDVNSHT